MHRGSCILVAAAALCAAPATAQKLTSPAGNSVQSFSADYFDPVHPADAYDMVRKLPGFEIIEGDDEVRGDLVADMATFFDKLFTFTPWCRERHIQFLLRGLDSF